jgi:4-hydroxy-2-oxoheptanedioate aldolase
MTERDGDMRPQVGTFISVPNIALAEALGSAFDVLIVDLEHGAVGIAETQALIIAIQRHGAAAYVRVARPDDPRLAAILDAGADGVVAPMIETPLAAEEFASRLQYPPIGRRGFGPRRAGNFGRRSILSDGAPTCVVQLETPAGVDAAARIGEVEGVDLLVLGCSDLSLALGTPGRVDSPAIRDAVARAGEAARRAGIGFGLAVGGELERIPSMVDQPVDLLLHGVDLRIYVHAADAVAVALREVTGQLAGADPVPPPTEQDRATR